MMPMFYTQKLKPYNTMQPSTNSKLILLLTLLSISGCVNVTHAQTSKKRIPLGGLLDSLNYPALTPSHIDTTNYIKEVYKQVITDIENGDASDTIKVLQEVYINDLLQENAEKDRTIKNRDSTVYEFRGEVLALRREDKYKSSLNAALNKEVKFTRRCLVGVLVLFVYTSIRQATH